MKNNDSEEEKSKRANQDDPIVMYLIVRESLNMSIGKTAAQCAHASQMLQIEYDRIKKLVFLGSGISYASEKEKQEYYIFHQWLDSSFRKVVLKADEREWKKIKEELSYPMVSVIDAGLTEVEPNTNTVIGVFPMYKSACPKIIKKLQLLK